MRALLVVVGLMFSFVCQAAEPGFFEPVVETVFVPGEPGNPLVQCRVVITYPPGRPDLVSFTYSSDCKNPEVAIAEALAALLRSEMPATPVPKPHG